MAKGLPDHWEIVVFQTQAGYVFDTDPLGIAALQTVGDVQRATPAFFAGVAQQALIPSAGRQLKTAMKESEKSEQDQSGVPSAGQGTKPEED
ncbi:MAG: hypothetical protein ACREPE_12330 [Lysobacter sp.]